ncbi:MAG: 6-phosphofructokinase 2 [Alphaproteobacteria bacterium]|jgi:6-phosphofructokinase 2
MKKIVTLTLSPSLDNTSETERVYPRGKLRCKTPKLEAGGGGINVARVITRLGGEATAVYPSGGATGEYLTNLLKADKVIVKPVTCNTWTRQNLNVTTTCDSQQYRFVMPGSPISADELKKIERCIFDQNPDYLVISGSLPENLDSKFVVSLVNEAKKKNIEIILDCSGQSLIDALNCGGLLLAKPNSKELATVRGAHYLRAGDLEREARHLVESGKCKIALISLGAQGALLVTKDVCEQIIPPKVVTNSTVGAGDSLVAAMVLSLARACSIREAARMGVAAGTAATMNSGTELCYRSDVDHLYESILLRCPI